MAVSAALRRPSWSVRAVQRVCEQRLEVSTPCPPYTSRTCVRSLMTQTELHTTPTHINQVGSQPEPHDWQQKRLMTTHELDRTRNGRQRVVILGSGWAGFPLARSLDQKKFQVVIVSPRSYFVFTPFLASTAVGTLEFRTALEPIRRRKKTVDYIQGRADDISFYDKTVTIREAVGDPNVGLAPTATRWNQEQEQSDKEGGRLERSGRRFELSYDKLVICVGSYTQTFGIPGVTENANFLKDVGDARKIRKRVLQCFELAALPTCTDSMRRQMLHFLVSGAGPTGLEVAAELHDLIKDDLSKLYPELKSYPRITLYDIAPKILTGFDDKLAAYAMDTFAREGIEIKTSRRVLGLSRGLPDSGPDFDKVGLTMDIKEDGKVGAGMVIWSTGLQSNPFIAKALSSLRKFPKIEDIIYRSDVELARKARWSIVHDKKTGSICTNDRLRVLIEAKDERGNDLRARMRDVFAIGDCATISGQPMLPATAQVANQKADWLAQRLNRDDFNTVKFHFRNAGLLAYVGGWRAIAQFGNDEGQLTGRAAWIAWRSAYIYKSLSWRNRILVPVYWIVNWIFGRDISRF